MREPRLISDKRVLKCTALVFFCLDWRRHQNSDCQQSEIVTDFQNCRIMCSGKLDLPLPEPEETGTNLQSI